jgi:glycerophosphoryl diester phosphodiesterase
MVLNIAHRGGAGLAPENTIACFKKGFLYADMVEFDIQPTKDRYLMVFHDRNGIERTTNGRGKIPDLIYNYLRSLDAGSWFSSRYKNEIIPTLSEVLEVVPENILLNIELKYYNPDSTWLEREIVRTIEKYKLVTRSVITARHVQCALLQKERERSDYFNLVLDLNLNTVQIRKSALDSTFIQECHDQQIKVFYFYADDQPEMIKAIKIGVDGILTNYPDRLKEVLTKEL